MKAFVTAVLVVALVAMGGAQQPATKNHSSPRNVVFVCEHGAALSVVAAAYFNKLTRERHLDMHAIARGVTAQDNISVAADAGLKKDGVAYETQKPQTLSQDDLDHADYVVTFLPLPEKYAVKSPIERWYDVVWTPNSYDTARDGILKHLQQLMVALKDR